MKLTNQIAHYIQACIIISSLLYSRSLASKPSISLYPLPFSSYSHMTLPLAHRSSLSLVFLSVSYPPFFLLAQASTDHSLSQCDLSSFSCVSLLFSQDSFPLLPREVPHHLFLNPSN